MTSITFTRPASLAGSPAVARLFETGNSIAPAILRITLALIILPHGLQKTVGWFGGYGFSATMGWFGSMGIPAILGFLAIAAESAGAIALVAGFGTRIAAFGIGVTMAVAAITHRANGFFMNWSGTQAGEGFEYHLLAIGIAAALILAGAGRYSVDRFLTRTSR